MVIAGVFGMIRSSPRPLSGPRFAEFAVETHREHAKGGLTLEILSDSQQTLNDWFKAKLQYPLALPASPAVPGEERPYHLEGARLVPVSGTRAAYISYRMKKGTASLIVSPDSVAVASGGVEADFKKVSFHYAMIEGYKVVTWSTHGLTYALVSDEGNESQAACMVCHSAMRDRDLSHTSTPLYAQRSSVAPFLQSLTPTTN
jgi:anti-sigma factor RsiW